MKEVMLLVIPGTLNKHVLMDGDGENTHFSMVFFWNPLIEATFLTRGCLGFQVSLVFQGCCVKTPLKTEGEDV